MRLFFGCMLLISFSLPASNLKTLISEVKPSVVAIAIQSPTNSPRIQFIGTGFITGNGKQVVTNYHVVAKTLNDDRRERYVVVSGTAKNLTVHPIINRRNAPQYDLAVLEIEQSLPALTLAADSFAAEGSQVAFTGFPISNVLGLYPATHQGIIAAITPIAIPVDNARELNLQAMRQLREPYPVYQLDAIAYPGNSGSPLYNTDNGEVLGIINMVHVKTTREAILSQPSGISYAIPVRHLRELLQQP